MKKTYAFGLIKNRTFGAIILKMEDLTNKWLVIVNPKACLGKSEKDWPDIKQILFDESIDFDAIVTEYPRHAIELVRDNITEKVCEYSFMLS